MGDTKTVTTGPGERLYLIDDAELGVVANRDPAVRERHVARYRHAIELAGATGGLWLDFACGSGYGTALCARVADWAVGADASLEAIAYAAKHHGGAGREFRVAGPLGVWSVMPTPDVLISIETLEHLPLPVQRAFLDEAAQRMQGGVVVLGCPIGAGGPNPANPWHVHEPTEPELRAALTARWSSVSFSTERYVSTSGPAVQAWAVCRHA